MIRAVLIRKLGQLVVLIACLWKRSKLICPAADAAGARAVLWHTVVLMAIIFEHRFSMLMRSLLLSFVLLAAWSVTQALHADEKAAQRKIVKLTDAGVAPQSLRMTTDESIVFFYNDTSDSLPTLELDFRGKTAHCASSTLKASTDGFIRSTKPIGVGDFASTCFHSPGEYDYKVLGLKNAPDGVPAKIIVE